jgi:hypothetical protein
MRSRSLQQHAGFIAIWVEFRLFSRQLWGASVHCRLAAEHMACVSCRTRNQYGTIMTIVEPVVAACMPHALHACMQPCSHGFRIERVSPCGIGQFVNMVRSRCTGSNIAYDTAVMLGLG